MSRLYKQFDVKTLSLVPGGMQDTLIIKPSSRVCFVYEVFYKINYKEVNWLFVDSFPLELYYLEANLFIMTVMHHIFVVYHSLGIYLC